MRPLNTRERRAQFLRFSLLFLLAVLPIVLLTWLFGRVDHVENDFLRSKYENQREQGKMSAKYTAYLAALSNSANELKGYVTKSNAMMSELQFTDIATLREHVGQLEKDHDNFTLVANQSNVQDSTMLLISSHFRSVATNLVDVYAKALDQKRDLDKDLKTAEEEFEKKKKEADDLQLQIMQYRTLK